MVFGHSVSIVFYGFNCFGAQKSLKEILKYYLKCTNLYVKLYTQIRSITYSMVPKVPGKTTMKSGKYKIS